MYNFNLPAVNYYPVNYLPLVCYCFQGKLTVLDENNNTTTKFCFCDKGRLAQLEDKVAKLEEVLTNNQI